MEVELFSDWLDDCDDFSNEFLVLVDGAGEEEGGAVEIDGAGRALFVVAGRSKNNENYIKILYNLKKEIFDSLEKEIFDSLEKEILTINTFILNTHFSSFSILLVFPFESSLLHTSDKPPLLGHSRNLFDRLFYSIPDPKICQFSSHEVCFYTAPTID